MEQRFLTDTEEALLYRGVYVDPSLRKSARISRIIHNAAISFPVHAIWEGYELIRYERYRD